MEKLKQQIPDYAKDLRINLGNVTRSEHLTAQQLWGTVLASALASRNEDVIHGLGEAALAELSGEAAQAAKAAAAIMAMNNVYYRTLHLMEDGDYQRMPARLRMQAMANPGVEKADFELWSFAVSAVNGCGQCLTSHEATLRKEGVRPEAIQDALRIASVVHAVAATLEGEQALPAAVGSEG